MYWAPDSGEMKTTVKVQFCGWLWIRMASHVLPCQYPSTTCSTLASSQLIACCVQQCPSLCPLCTACQLCPLCTACQLCPLCTACQCLGSLTSKGALGLLQTHFVAFSAGDLYPFACIQLTEDLPIETSCAIDCFLLCYHLKVSTKIKLNNIDTDTDTAEPVY